MHINSDRMALVLFALSISVLVYGFGIITHKYELFPYPVVRDTLRSLLETEEYDYLVPVRHSQSGVKIHDRSSMSPGLTLITSFWQEGNWGAGAKIFNIDGETLHHWKVDPTGIWPETPYTDSMAGTMNIKSNYIHGSYLFPNGDILVNIEYLGLVRLDACGQVLWKLPYRTHHSITRASDGNFWVSGMKWIDEADEQRFPGLQAPYAEDTVIKVSPDGEVLKEISILQALFDSGYQYLLWKYNTTSGDLTHINDVESLESSIASNYPLFEAGDLLISLKHISSIAVLSQSGQIKWIDSHHFNRQHDPDFEQNGWIVVFDNREDLTDTGEYLGGSAISAINPSDVMFKHVYPSDGSKKFFTNAGGKHQLLDNGNRLITEVRGARVFEIDSNGQVLWEWVKEPYNSKVVPEVMEGTRYDLNQEIVSQWQCSP